MQNIKWKSVLFVSVQFGCLLYLVVSAPLIAHPVWLLSIEAAGIALGFWSVGVMLSSGLSVFPDVKNDARLIQKGPYSIIRHPMYTALIFTFLPLVIAYFSWPRLVVYIVLVINQLFKLTYEEKLLAHHFQGYTVYQTKTYKILPFVW